MTVASDSLEFIFVRVPRTASTTLIAYLEMELWDDLNQPGLEELGGFHDSAMTLREVWGEKWDRYFTFGFIRNPWEWFVSLYNSGISVGARGKESWPGPPEELTDMPGVDVHPGQRMNCSFTDWVLDRKTTPMDWLCDDDDNVLVDSIYRFEDFVPGVVLRKSAMPHDDYRTWYDAELAEYVATKCAREIKVGDYVFNGAR